MTLHTRKRLISASLPLSSRLLRKPSRASLPLAFKARNGSARNDHRHDSNEGNQSMHEAVQLFASRLPSRGFKWIKGIVPRPTPSTLMVSAGLYLVAVCSTLERQQGGHWLSLVLEAKLPGLTTPCQNTPWESFEGVMREYVVCDRHQYDAQVDLSTSRALLKLGPSWSKQVRRALVGLFLDTGSPLVSGGAELDGTHVCHPSKHIADVSNSVLPWYQVDACVSPSRVIWASREGSNLEMGKGLEPASSAEPSRGASPLNSTASPYTSPSSPLAVQHKRATGKEGRRVTGNVLPFLYALPGYTGRWQALIEDDSIPAKLESPYSTLGTGGHHLSVFDGDLASRDDTIRLYSSEHAVEQKTALCPTLPGAGDAKSQHAKQPLLPSKAATPSQDTLAQKMQADREGYLGKEWALFQDALREAFYRHGLLPPPNWDYLYDWGGSEGGDAPNEMDGDVDELLAPNTKQATTHHNNTGLDVTNGVDLGMPSSLSMPPLEVGDGALERGNEQKDAITSGAVGLLDSLHLTTGEGLLGSQMALDTQFVANELLPNRLMSGYKFPDLTQPQTHSLYVRYAIPYGLLPFWRSFSTSQWQDLVARAPLRIVLPPGLPHSLCRDALSKAMGVEFINTRSASSGRGEQCFGFQPQVLSGDSRSYANRWKDSNLLISYRPICLEEIKQVAHAFERAGREYSQYVKQPKDTPSAIRISPSLEEDQLIQSKHLQSSLAEEDANVPSAKTKPTKLELLRNAQQRGHAAEQAKELRAFAYDNRLALYPTSPNYDVPTPSHLDLNPWIVARLGHGNMLSDRKHTFFGRFNVLPKRLVAKEQEEINQQILGGMSPRQDHRERSENDKRCNAPLPDLQARARRDLIDLLSEPDLKARDAVGFWHRHHNPDPRLRATRLRLKMPHLDSLWQKRKVRSTLLGAPSRRYVVMPTISQRDWKEIVDWQVREYLYAEERRLQPLIQEHPERTFKIKRINVYLPWVTLRTPLNKPFEWPVTRLDLKQSNGCGLIPFQHKMSESQLPYWHKATPQAQRRGLPVQQHAWAPPLSSTAQLANYWTIKSRYTLSSREDPCQLGTFPNQPASRNGGFDNMSNSSDRSARRVINRHLLFEALSKHSWLLVYQLLLMLLLKDVLKYIYRVQLRSFVLSLLRSEIGVAITSPELRERLEHGSPQLLYASTKRLQDVAAPEDALPTLSEVIWFLRNAGRARAQIRGLLIGGPPGAEKIALAQAIAGEAQVPIIAQSMSSLLLTHKQPYERLEGVFALARRRAPCVLFLDNIDEIGRSRHNVVRNDRSTADALFSLDLERGGASRVRFAQMQEDLQTSHLSRHNPYAIQRSDPYEGSTSCQRITDREGLNGSQGELKGVTARGIASPVAGAQAEAESRRIHILLQLLTEIDGVRPLNGVIIVATSERTTSLDPALLRPGRFDRIVHLQLPNHDRRVQIFKNETRRIGHTSTLPWDYLGIRTATWSAAEIVSAINHSAIRAILDDTAHTMETLEHGINCVIGIPTLQPKARHLSRTDPFYTSRLAFYQAGKGVVQGLLLDHPQIAVLSLTEPLSKGDAATLKRGPLQAERCALQGGLRYWTRRKQARAAVDLCQDESTLANGGGMPSTLSYESDQEGGNKTHQSREHTHLEVEATHTISSPRTRLDLEVRLIGLYAGKAGELLHISSKRISPVESVFKRLDNNHNTYKGARLLGCEQPSDPRVQTSQDRPTTSTLPLMHIASGATTRKWLLSPGYLWQSNIGSVELLAASSLAHLAIDRWHLYSQKLMTLKTNRVIRSLNREQVSDQDAALLRRLGKRLRSCNSAQSAWGRLGRDRDQPTSSNDVLLGEHEVSPPPLTSSTRGQQGRELSLWWQARICQELEVSERPYGRWYRLYLPKVEESERNEEWMPPDIISHQSAGLAHLNRTGSATASPAKTINDLYTVERDDLYQTIVMNCFYAAFHLLNENRELLDLCADHLIRFHVLRSHEMVRMCSLYLQAPSPRGDAWHLLSSASPHPVSKHTFETLD